MNYESIYLFIFMNPFIFYESIYLFIFYESITNQFLLIFFINQLRDVKLKKEECNDCFFVASSALT